MWPGPYGNLGSRLHHSQHDQSLKRMAGVCRPSIITVPIPTRRWKKVSSARQRGAPGALYAGISAYNAKQTPRQSRSCAIWERPV
jgi:hypothetical protein